ncbi:MAG: hypothetical protein OXI17_03060 [Gammaproteobacteria bacterium]|nr:hypothetical protein [Gammaproteobacteria bacterium]
MQAEDILTATHKLEESGMTRSESEAIANTIIAAVAPLATKADVESMREATKADLESIRKQMATKADLASMKEHMATKKDVESVKVWYLLTLLGAVGTMLYITD